MGKRRKGAKMAVKDHIPGIAIGAVVGTTLFLSFSDASAKKVQTGTFASPKSSSARFRSCLCKCP